MEPAAGVVVDLPGDGDGETDDVVVERFFKITLAGDEAGLLICAEIRAIPHSDASRLTREIIVA